MARLIEADKEILQALQSNSLIQQCTLDQLESDYENIVVEFHSCYQPDQAKSQVDNALFHKKRYLNLLKKRWNGKVLDVGNDKPFLSFFLRKFNENSSFITVSFEIPGSPIPLYEVDVEQEELPFDDETFDVVIFTEVIEHLWRDPSHCLWQINRVMKEGGDLYLTTPNPCDMHSLICVLWQANPNQRSQYFSSLESGHLHLWTCSDVKIILENNGFCVRNLLTENQYGHTILTDKVEEFVSSISPHRELMNETVVAYANKSEFLDRPIYPSQIFPDGCPVQLQGAIVDFCKVSLL